MKQSGAHNLLIIEACSQGHNPASSRSVRKRLDVSADFNYTHTIPKPLRIGLDQTMCIDVLRACPIELWSYPGSTV